MVFFVLVSVLKCQIFLSAARSLQVCDIRGQRRGGQLSAVAGISTSSEGHDESYLDPREQPRENWKKMLVKGEKDVRVMDVLRRKQEEE